MRHRGHCPKCRRSYDDVQYTEHHILPKRLFPGSCIVIDLCRPCHDQIEKRIPFAQKMPRSFYFLVVNNFLGYEAVKDYGKVK